MISITELSSAEPVSATTATASSATSKQQHRRQHYQHASTTTSHALKNPAYLSGKHVLQLSAENGATNSTQQHTITTRYSAFSPATTTSL